MSFKYKGYCGTILRVDLSSGEISRESLSETFAERFIGGSGFISKILWDETGPATDPLGPENRLIFATGPLTGVGLPYGPRIQIGAKSPLTGAFGDSSMCGDWAPALKYAGYDAIVIKGASPKPVYLWIDDDCVELREAGDLWGRCNTDVQQAIKELNTDHTVQVLSIGPAGENLVRYASIAHKSRMAGRCGLGAVMGSKNLKAVAVRGSKDIRVAQPELFPAFRKEFGKKTAVGVDYLRQYGKSILMDWMNAIARHPVKNFQSGFTPLGDQVSAEEIQKYKIKDRGEAGCHALCEKTVCVKKGPYKGLYKQPEFECISAFGPRIWIHDPEFIFYASDLCDELGMDAVSAGGTISWAMECFEEGIITKEDTGGVDLSWGNQEGTLTLLNQMARREGFGELLAEGSFRAAERIGRGSDKFVMCVKKMEIGAQDPRAQVAMGLANGVSSRGADHCKSSAYFDEAGLEEPVIARWGKEYLPEMIDPLSSKYKPFEVKDGEDYCAFVSTLVLCLNGVLFEYYYPGLAEVLEIVTGMSITADQVQVIGERIVNLQRAYNIREGLNRKDDGLPDRFTKVPAPEGPPKGHVVDMENLLDEYYDLRGWEKETGLIKEDKLRELWLEETVHRV
jgi:aldehyde:ferredoxin oxidoreductase